MTRNQIEYLKHLETMRNNRAVESNQSRLASESERHNLETEKYNYAHLGEVTRSNLAREDETRRSNLVSESLKGEANRIQEAYNREQIELRQLELTENQRANLAREELGLQQLQESYRSHTANERLQRYVAEEQARSNLANEAVRQMTLNEQIRSNLASERLKSSSIYIEQGRLDELIRSNLASEAVRRQEIEQRERASIRQSNTSLSVAGIQAETQRLSIAEQQRSNRARENELRRSNLASEENQRIRTEYDYAIGLQQTIDNRLLQEERNAISMRQVDASRYSTDTQARTQRRGQNFDLGLGVINSATRWLPLLGG